MGDQHRRAGEAEPGGAAAPPPASTSPTAPFVDGAPAAAAPAGLRAGFIALCGRPNVGKSTLLNALIGEPIAVATASPQTTRERLLGIWTGDDFQAVLVDTPGIHRPRSALNRFMVDQALRAAKDVDLILLLAEAPSLADAAAAEAWEPGPMQREVLERLAGLARPIALVLTKVDQLADPRLMIPLIATWSQLHPFAAVVPVSALQGHNLDRLVEVVRAHLPPAEAYLYDPDHLSDRQMRWHAAEIVRGQLFEHLGEELPYSCAVTVGRYKEGRRSEAADRIEATIHVERDSQKGMVIGKGGQTIRAISTAARATISRLTGRPCDLFLDVRVEKNWTRDPAAMERLGYRNEPEGRSEPDGPAELEARGALAAQDASDGHDEPGEAQP